MSDDHNPNRLKDAPGMLEEITTLPGDATRSLFQLDGIKNAPDVDKLVAAPEALRALPADFVKRHRVLPFAVRNGTLHIATSAAGNQRLIEDIRIISGLEVEEFLAPEPEILKK